MGLSFSVPKGFKVPPSLRNVYKALENDKLLSFVPPAHGDLTQWALQGVLLLNAVLTVRAGKSCSHMKLGWESLTNAVVREIGKRKKSTVFMFWGKFAQKSAKLLDPEWGCKVLEHTHPSPLAGTSFLECRHFSMANSYLKEAGLGEIDWRIE